MMNNQVLNFEHDWLHTPRCHSCDSATIHIPSWVGQIPLLKQMTYNTIIMKNPWKHPLGKNGFPSSTSDGATRSQVTKPTQIPMTPSSHNCVLMLLSNLKPKDTNRLQI
jgi:hypothetical protein